ncbi:hypothetical protein MMC13_005439 [Lambiella insularis]|nr:hypothetical protein [Lambiella insularis]
MGSCICRLRYRRGEPLGLSYYRALNFSDLPFEIRSKVYRLVLVYQNAVIVSVQSEKYCKWLPDSIDYELDLGILQVSKAISVEAAAIFYRFNTFAFYGHDTWTALFNFLVIIDPANRAHLRHIKAGISKPLELTRLAGGTLVASLEQHCAQCEIYPPENCPRKSLQYEVYPPDNHPRLRPPYDRIGDEIVDHVNSSIEAVFRILGSDGPLLQLTLMMEYGLVPGVQIGLHDEEPERDDWSLEIPDHLERLRKLHTVGNAGKGKVRVLWKGRVPKMFFYPYVEEEIKEAGWKYWERKKRNSG